MSIFFKKSTPQEKVFSGFEVIKLLDSLISNVNYSFKAPTLLSIFQENLNGFFSYEAIGIMYFEGEKLKKDFISLSPISQTYLNKSSAILDESFLSLFFNKFNNLNSFVETTCVGKGVDSKSKILDVNSFLTLPFFLDDEILCVVGLYSQNKNSFLLSESTKNLILSARKISAILSRIESIKNSNALLLEKTFGQINKPLQDQSLIDDYYSLVVHDLRSPLTVIKGTIDILLSRDTELEQNKKKDLLQQISLASSLTISIVNDLLDVSRIEAKKLDLNIVQNDLTDLVTKTASIYKNFINSKGLELKLDVPPNKVLAKFDFEKIERALSNFISNAVKFTTKGRILISLKVEGDNAMVSVEDTGCGLSEEEQKNLFNKFKQMKNAKDTKEKGSGLGLVIAKGIIEGHKGEIKVESKEGRGSTFSFLLPLE